VNAAVSFPSTLLNLTSWLPESFLCTLLTTIVAVVLSLVTVSPLSSPNDFPLNIKENAPTGLPWSMICIDIVKGPPSTTDSSEGVDKLKRGILPTVRYTFPAGTLAREALASVPSHSMVAPSILSWTSTRNNVVLSLLRKAPLTPGNTDVFCLETDAKVPPGGARAQRANPSTPFTSGLQVKVAVPPSATVVFCGFGLNEVEFSASEPTTLVEMTKKKESPERYIESL
jgi:hypothetical protein